MANCINNNQFPKYAKLDLALLYEYKPKKNKYEVCAPQIKKAQATNRKLVEDLTKENNQLRKQLSKLLLRNPENPISQKQVSGIVESINKNVKGIEKRKDISDLIDLKLKEIRYKDAKKKYKIKNPDHFITEQDATKLIKKMEKDRSLVNAVLNPELLEKDTYLEIIDNECYKVIQKMRNETVQSCSGEETLVCQAIIKNGDRKGQKCGRKRLKNSNGCRYHFR